MALHWHCWRRRNFRVQLEAVAIPVSIFLGHDCRRVYSQRTHKLTTHETRQIPHKLLRLFAIAANCRLFTSQRRCDADSSRQLVSRRLREAGFMWHVYIRRSTCSRSVIFFLKIEEKLTYVVNYILNMDGLYSAFKRGFSGYTDA